MKPSDRPMKLNKNSTKPSRYTQCLVCLIFY